MQPRTIFSFLSEMADSKEAHPTELQLLNGAEKGDFAAVRNAVQNNVSINAFFRKNRRTALFLAAANKHLEIVMFLLHYENTKVDARDVDKVTPLMIASNKGYINIVRLLLSAGADVNAANVSGATSLHLAAQLGFTDIVDVLIANGATLNVQGGKNHNTPLMLAALNGNISIVRLLLKAKADTAITNKNNKTALDLASNSSIEELIKQSVHPQKPYTRIQEILQQLNVALKKDNQEVGKFSDLPSVFCCPLTLSIMEDPVTAADGFVYERKFIEKWIKECEAKSQSFISPITKKPLIFTDLYPSQFHRAGIIDYLQSKLASLAKKTASVVLTQAQQSVVVAVDDKESKSSITIQNEDQLITRMENHLVITEVQSEQKTPSPHMQKSMFTKEQAVTIQEATALETQRENYNPDQLQPIYKS